MHAVVRRYEGVDSTRVDELTRRVQEGAVPLISGTPGFVAYYVVDAGGGAVASISLFGNKPGADESGRRVGEFVLRSMADLLPNPPQVTAGEVLVDVTK